MSKIERTKNAGRNIIFGVLLKTYQIILPFIIRTVMIYYMGVKYVGLNSLFSSILQVLNLTELGVGAAMVFSMYRPIAEDDTSTICALMKLYKLYYRVIGMIIAIIGICITPIIPRLITGEIPEDINIYVLYFINLATTVISYWLFAYKNAVLQAHQRNDVTSRVSLAVNSVQYLIQIIIIVLLKSYYFFILIAFLSQATINIITAFYANKLYPSYIPKGNLKKENIKKINGRIKDLFTSKVGGVIYDSVDTIVISSFLGLALLAIYQNYFFILSSINAFITVIFNACLAGIGNSIIVETKEKNYSDLKKFTFIICWISGFCSICLLCLYQPFMELWVGTSLMLNYSCVICLVVYFFVRQINQLLNLYKDASGMWHEDRFRPLIAALTNLCLNILLVKYIGIYGIILSTVFSILIVGMPWLLHNLFHYVFAPQFMPQYIFMLIKYTIVVMFASLITMGICYAFDLSPIVNFFVRLIICCIVPNTVFYIFFKNASEFEESLKLANNITNGKISSIICKMGKKG